MTASTIWPIVLWGPPASALWTSLGTSVATSRRQDGKISLFSLLMTQSKGIWNLPLFLTSQSRGTGKSLSLSASQSVCLSLQYSWSNQETLGIQCVTINVVTSPSLVDLFHSSTLKCLKTFRYGCCHTAENQKKVKMLGYPWPSMCPVILIHQHTAGS